MPKQSKQIRKDSSSYWLFLNSYVHLNVKKTMAVLYNSLNGTLFEFKPGTKVFGILKSLYRKENLYVSRLNASRITPEVETFISDIRESFSGDIVDTAWTDGKPVQLIPRLVLEQTLDELPFDPKIKILRRDEIGNYLNVLNLFITNRCTQGCPRCNEAYKQFLHCGALSRRSEEISLADVEALLAQVRNTDLYQINVLGGDIFKHPEISPITRLLNDIPIHKGYFVYYKNFVNCIEWMHLISEGRNNSIHLLLDNSVNDKRMEEIQRTIRRFNIDTCFQFSISNEDEIPQIENWVTEFDLKNVELKPFYDGGSLDFFRDNVLITSESISESQPTMRDIFSRSAINSLNFKSLTVLSDKSVYANLNHSKLGNLSKSTIMELIKKELERGVSWGRVRKNVSPCKSCAYNAVCPPVSNYEYVIGKYNLCRLWILRNK